ncbi:MAG: sugar O-acetyltransferase [Gammaproteobacteria bacterium]|jgi:maltose O-acetyltransferase|nr:sugar O-acetyltransferase [Gammaproteobacteria bacterium]MBU2178538.1 sugar O-acetyltransferase [Gammaproteobacteria bacterium]MBU2225170.1 sugar O-acetyltransferase [Gammaproteobacteria bacterium]MBU2426828.1 sugar O-acetyltransferase [Gammaproteobacteria bacterium]
MSDMAQTEKQKMLSQQWFNPRDPELGSARARAKKLCRELNDCTPEAFKASQKIASQLFGKVQGCYIEPDFYCDYGFNIELGPRFYANHHCVMLDAAPIRIGADVMLGPAVQLYTVTHPLDAALRQSGIEQAKPIIIGNRVWIGGGAIVLPGVEIGDDAVIAAGSIVTKNVAAATMVRGNPARPVRSLHNLPPLPTQLD